MALEPIDTTPSAALRADHRRWDWFSPKGNPRLFRGDNDRGCLERGDLDQWLGIQEQQKGVESISTNSPGRDGA